jgi:hypothetical protein
MSSDPDGPGHDAGGDDVDWTLETTGDLHLPAGPPAPGDEGGDPACWAHLFEDGPASGTRY